jgi:uncharacterized PurR-regulated membrane protein YhhQ (DUF165 family)
MNGSAAVRKVAALALYVLCIPAANWLMLNVGYAGGDGPHLLPIGFGLMAPSGILAIGAALYLRDLVQNLFGVRIALMAVAAGVVVTAVTSSPALAVASATAYCVSELADLMVYTPLKVRGLTVSAILASGVVGSAVDSAVFLWLAFGSLAFVGGQTLGKIEVTAVCAGIAWVKLVIDARHRRGFRNRAHDEAEAAGAGTVEMTTFGDRR